MVRQLPVQLHLPICTPHMGGTTLVPDPPQPVADPPKGQKRGLGKSNVGTGEKPTRTGESFPRYPVPHMHHRLCLGDYSGHSI